MTTEFRFSEMSDLTALLFVLLQKTIPKALLTAVVFRLARIRNTRVKNFFIRQFVNFYKVDIEEVLLPVPDGFVTFNDFFIRELEHDARSIDSNSDVIVSPVDGTVSAAGVLDKDSIIQAKGLRYSMTDLLATDTQEAQSYINGAFATIYLAPYNYHRVHAPLAGKLVAARYVPGDLFSVNEATVAHLPGLFVRNERLICHLLTDTGPMVLIFVGAMNVGSISTIWTGDIKPRTYGVAEQINLADVDGELSFSKGDNIGWFNMGSTVILLMPAECTNNFADLAHGQTVRVGEVIGRMAPPP